MQRMEESAVVCVTVWRCADGSRSARILVAREEQPVVETWRGSEPTLDELCERVRLALEDLS